MAPHTTTRVDADPPIEQWHPSTRRGDRPPVFATGHQPTLWHPGILVKDLAVDRLAQRHAGAATHIVVEHNPLGPLTLDLPTRQDQTLSVQRFTLDDRPAAALTPPNRLPPLDTARLADRLHQAATLSTIEPVRAGLNRLAQAYAALPEAEHLAAQTSAVLAALMRPYLLGPPPRLLPTSELVTPGFVDRLLADPAGCVRAYNRAAAAYPEAGIRPLYAGRDVVEAPLWAQDDAGATPVFIDLGDSGRPYLFTQGQRQGQSLDLTGPGAIGYLRPRALTLSAIMRGERCDFFVHGRGGGVYDQVTERWWGDWTGKPLAPMAVVSADVYLPLDAPVATRAERDRAVWFDHHLPFNVDRFAGPVDDAEASLHAEKRALLDHMNDDRDKRRRAKAFKRIHAINDALRQRHRDRLAQAHQAAERARRGVANRAVAERRDWCFALYPRELLHQLLYRISS